MLPCTLQTREELASEADLLNLVETDGHEQRLTQTRGVIEAQRRHASERASASSCGRTVPQLGNTGIGQDKRAVSRVYSDDLNADTLATQEDDAVAAAGMDLKPVGLVQNLVQNACLIVVERDSVTSSGGLALERIGRQRHLRLASAGI